MKIICRCEDLSEEEIINFIHQGFTTLDEIKRFSRAGMGHCQGRTCFRLIAQLISEKTNLSLNKIPYPIPRPPIKPIPFKVLSRVERSKNNRGNP
jgi:NAD(P)H-nitrite reductase large subunit